MLDMSVKFMDNLVVPPKTIEDFIDLKINHGRFSKKKPWKDYSMFIDLIMCMMELAVCALRILSPQAKNGD